MILSFHQSHSDYFCPFGDQKEVYSNAFLKSAKFHGSKTCVHLEAIYSKSHSQRFQTQLKCGRHKNSSLLV